jgi:hypothetical protein
VRAALALVSRGEAPFGIVSDRCAADKGVRIVDIPEDTHRHCLSDRSSQSQIRCRKGSARPSAPTGARPVWEKHGFGSAN